MNPINGLFKVGYWPICRLYARCLGDRPADVLLRLLCIPQFLRVNRYWPNFIKPRRFSEKLWSRQLHDRDPKLTVISDKLLVRDYVASKVGINYLVPLLWRGDNPEEIPFDELPNKFVIKTNHGCEYNIIVYDKTKLDREKAKQQLKKWLGENFGQDTFLGIAWGYKNIRPTIFIESFIEDHGKVPVDYKFWCFSGKIEFISLHFDRFENYSTLSFSRNFELGGGLNFGLPLYSGTFKVPSNYKEIVRVAESLAEGFDFIRVDLYMVENKIYFSELTPYPGGVTTRFVPVKQDFQLGEKWYDFKIYTLK